MSNIKKEEFHILVVDDEPFVLNIAVLILNKLGYSKVDTAANGEIAIDRIANKLILEYNLVICDLNMPKMNGVEFLRHAHECSYSGGIILVSGHDERMLQTATDLAAAHNLNILGALQKPLQSDSLKKLIEEYKPAVNENLFVPQASISVDELREGVAGEDCNELVLLYQPKIDIHSGEVVAVEALARWRHPSRGVLGPGAFIPLATENELIDELTLQIFRRAVLQVSSWLDDDIILKMSVNFSVTSFSNPAFSDALVRITEEVGVNPSLLVLEVTETQVLANVVSSLESLMNILFKNFGLSIFDFGTGKSSLEQLKIIPFTEMKIDRAFVHGAIKNTSALAILETSVDLAKRLGMTIVAEGVETKQDWDLVEQLKCDYVQGFFCAEPMENQEFLEFLGNWTGPNIIKERQV